MNVQEQIKKYIASQPEPKRSDMRDLHRLTLQVSPECKLWFFDGKDSKNHTVSNPTIGYGFHTIKYANGKSREFFRIGVSGNKTGISVYILGLKDKKYLAKTYGKKLGKASVTGYCIRFKALKDINIDTLEAVAASIAVTLGNTSLSKTGIVVPMPCDQARKILEQNNYYSSDNWDSGWNIFLFWDPIAHSGGWEFRKPDGMHIRMKYPNKPCDKTCTLDEAHNDAYNPMNDPWGHFWNELVPYIAGQVPRVPTGPIGPLF